MTGASLRLTDTYARVLFGLASEEDCIDTVRDDLLLLLILLERDPQFHQVLVSPYFSPDYNGNCWAGSFPGGLPPDPPVSSHLVRHRRTASCT